MIVIGITGSIGMGKTTVSNMLRDMGIPVHDADAAVHSLLGPNGKAVATVGKKFPGTLKDGAIDRKALGTIVFNDAQKKKELEDILHPLVWAESDAFIEEMRRKNAEIIALDIPLLFETNRLARFTATICVTASPETQRSRVMSRPGMTEEKFQRIIATQLPDAEKRKRADYVIDTDQDFEGVQRQMTDVIEKLKQTHLSAKNHP